MKMFVTKFFLIFRQTQRNIFGTNCLRALSSRDGNHNSTIRDGILYSDTSDIEIPSANITDILFERIEPFQKFKAIVSI